MTFSLLSCIGLQFSVVCPLLSIELAVPMEEAGGPFDAIMDAAAGEGSGDASTSRA